MAWDDIPDNVWEMRKRTVWKVFTPGAPIDRREVFAGRLDQLQAVDEVVLQKGQHAAIYGERGVGKTSLAKIAKEVADKEKIFSAHVTCDSSDDFDSIWRKVFEEIRVVLTDKQEVTGSYYLGDIDRLTPNAVRVVLQELTRGAPAVIFIDEFDVVRHSTTQLLLAETMKVLSDQGIDATVVLAGVAENIVDLIGQHASTERSLTQVPMPRMTIEEREAIIENGLTPAGMTIDAVARHRIVTLSQGLAHFVHLLAQRAALLALLDNRTNVKLADVSKAIDTSIADTQVSVSSNYEAAVKSNRKSLYPDLVLACAMISPDEHGYFTAKALVGPLTTVTGEAMTISQFGPHLKELATSRGLLHRDGDKRKYRYRFRNPLVQPYVLMRGVKESRIDHTDVLGANDDRERPLQ